MTRPQLGVVGEYQPLTFNVLALDPGIDGTGFALFSVPRIAQPVVMPPLAAGGVGAASSRTTSGQSAAACAARFAVANYLQRAKWLRAFGLAVSSEPTGDSHSTPMRLLEVADCLRFLLAQVPWSGELHVLLERPAIAGRYKRNEDDVGERGMASRLDKLYQTMGALSVVAPKDLSKALWVVEHVAPLKGNKAHKGGVAKSVLEDARIRPPRNADVLDAIALGLARNPTNALWLDAAVERRAQPGPVEVNRLETAL